MTTKELVERLRGTESRSKRKILDEAADIIDSLERQIATLNLQALKLNNEIEELNELVVKIRGIDNAE